MSPRAKKADPYALTESYNEGFTVTPQAVGWPHERSRVFFQLDRHDVLAMIHAIESARSHVKHTQALCELWDRLQAVVGMEGVRVRNGGLTK